MIEIQALNDIIASCNTEEELHKKQEILQNFKCDKDEDIQIFLSKFAKEYEAEHISRTFLVMDSDFPGQILGYFAIGLNSMQFDEKLNVPDAYEGINLYENGYRPIYKLFMLGKNDNFSKKVRMSKIFNSYILAYIKLCKRLVGGNLMYIDCDNNDKLRKYYEGLKFKYYDTLTENNLIRMIRKI